MNAAGNLASRKLVVALVAILAVALNSRLGMLLTDEEIRAIADIAMTAIGSQAGIDLAGKLVPMLLGRGTIPAAPASSAAP